MISMIKIVFIVCGFLAAVLACAKLFCKECQKESVQALKEAAPAVLFLIATYGIFIPSALFLGNAKEFTIAYTAILPLIGIVSATLLAGTLAVAVILSGKRLFYHYVMLLFGGTLGLYAQSSFLNPKLPKLNGTKIDWSLFALSGAVSAGAWLFCIIGIQLLTWFYREKTCTVAKYVSYFLSVVQMLSLVILFVTAKGGSASDIALSKEDEFAVGSRKNIVVFVLDSFESADFEAFMKADEKRKADFTDFTFYRNAVSGGAYTSVAMPVLLTGVEYDPTCGTYENYLKEAWGEATLYADLKAQNFDVRLFTDARFMTNIPDGVIDNAQPMESSYYITDYTAFGKDFYKFVNFYAMPQHLKQMFWLYGDDVSKTIQAAPVDEKQIAPGGGHTDKTEYYKFDDVLFYQDFSNAGGLLEKYENAFRLYHLFGAHGPYTMNEAMERTDGKDTSKGQQAAGSISIVLAYIAQLKQQGLYDNSTIIITADHGDHAANAGIEQNPMYLMKEAGEKHPYAVSAVPIHFRNVVATIAAAAMEDYAAYGPAIGDIDENSDVERLHTVISDAARDFEALYEERTFNRFIIPADARDNQNIRHHDVYGINRFRYVLGDDIAFTPDNAYADAISYRLYRENGTGIASNELTLCMELGNAIEGDVEWHFTYADVYHDSQRIRIYANGDKIANITCTREGIGQEQVVVIPAGCIKEGMLRLRLVFPNAVTPHQLDATNPDTRVLSVAFTSMRLESAK